MVKTTVKTKKPSKDGLVEQIKFAGTLSRDDESVTRESLNPLLCVPVQLSKCKTEYKTLYSRLSVENRAKFLRDCVETGEDLLRLREERGWGVYVRAGSDGDRQLKLAKEHALAEYGLRERTWKEGKQKKEAVSAREKFFTRITAPGYVMTNLDKVLLRKYGAEEGRTGEGEGAGGSTGESTSESTSKSTSEKNPVAGGESVSSNPTSSVQLSSQPSSPQPSSQPVTAPPRGFAPRGSASIKDPRQGDSPRQEIFAGGEEPEILDTKIDPSFYMNDNAQRVERASLDERLMHEESPVLARKRQITRDSVLDELQAHKERRNRWMSEIEQVAVVERPWAALAKLDGNTLAQLRMESEIAGVLKEIKGNTVIAVAIGTSGAIDQAAILAGDDRRLSADARMALAGVGISRKMNGIRELAGAGTTVDSTPGPSPEARAEDSSNGSIQSSIQSGSIQSGSNLDALLESELARGSGESFDEKVNAGRFLLVHRDGEGKFGG